MSTTDSPVQTADNTSTGPAAAGLDTSKIDPLDSLKQLLQLNKTSDSSSSSTLASPNTDKLFAKTGSDSLPTSGIASPTDKGPASDKTPGFAGDRQVGPGPWDSLNSQLNQSSGSLNFNDNPIKTDSAYDLRSRFQDELKDGKLDSDPIWKNFVNSTDTKSLTSQDWKSLTSNLSSDGLSKDFVKKVEEASQKGLTPEQQKELQKQLENNPGWQKALQDIELKKLLDTKPDDSFKKYINEHPDAAKAVDKANDQTHAQVEQEHQKLNDWAEKNLKEPELSKFKKDMTSFEDRAKHDGLSQEEVLKTYQQIERLTNAQGDKPLSQIDRRHLAQEVMHQAADPTDISQGSHLTCNVTSVETRTYTRTPSDAARLVADVALTGQYTAGDGTKVKIDPTAHDQSKVWPPVDGQRTHASEIFEVTAVNLHYAKENAKNGTDIRYVQTEPNKADKADTGERLMDYSKTPPKEVKDGLLGFGDPVHQPALSDNDVAEISDSITGKHEKDVLLQAWGSTKDGVTAVHSEAELKEKLKELKANHKLPAIVFVDTQNEPFYTDSGRGTAGGSGGYHVVTVTDYNEKTGAVCIDNEWSKAADHGVNNTVSVHDLFTAMQLSGDAEKTLQADVKYNRDHGISDPAKEADLLRHQIANKDISPEDAEKELTRIMDETGKRWAKGNVSQQEQLREWKEMEALIHNLPPDAQIRLAKHAHDDKLRSDQWYKQELELAGWQSIHDHNHAGRIFGYNPFADSQYEKEQAEMKKALAGLSPADQTNVLQIIQWYVHNNP